jgi:hypothetical protein
MTALPARHAPCFQFPVMSTQTLLIIIIVFLILGGGGFYWRGRR